MMTSADRQTKQYTLFRNPHTAAGQAISIHDSVPTQSTAAALRVQPNTLSSIGNQSVVAFLPL